MATINRTGSVSFGDASLSVWEEGIAAARQAGGWAAAEDWERQFKRDVFARIVQQLNRLGWTCEIPEDYVKQYSLSFARDRRNCHKGDLKGWLEICGRHIEFKMWQSINTPTRPDHGGKYESDKEGVMPYVLRLEMERTRRRIRDYLCGVMWGYTFDPKHRSIYRKPLERTAMECIEERYAESRHFKGDWPAYVEHETRSGWGNCFNGNRTSADRVLLEHGQRVYFFDRKGRICTGQALYNINNMWWVVTGRYDYTNMACFELYSTAPDNFRVKRNARLRRKRLEGELSKATKVMNFERAALVRDLLFPRGAQLYVVWHDDHKAYHCAGFSGYTNNINDAGKFTADEVHGWSAAPNKVMELEAA